MIDIKIIETDKEYVKANLRLRFKNYDQEIDEISKLYAKYKENLLEVEALRAKLNEKSKLIGEYKREGKDVASLLAEIEAIKKGLENDQAKDLKLSYEKILMGIPNLIQDDTPIGEDEESNVEIRKFMEPKVFNFPVKAHYELELADGRFDFEKGAQITKSRFVVTTGLITKMERALMNMMLDTHSKHKYLEVAVPFVVSDETLLGSSNLPKFEEDLFKIAQSNDADDSAFADLGSRELYLNPTAEVALCSFHRNEILDAAMLPINYCAFAQSFRKEAGGAGRDTRGYIRMHQFGKVEMFKFTDAETSNVELEKMVEDAERVLQLLKLPYRVIRLCSGDMGFSSSKTYDLEVWFPSQAKYRECSSCSNVRDFQARRVMTRTKIDGETRFVHTLNGSGLATGRILAAILENYQNEDGTITVPEALREYLR